MVKYLIQFKFLTNWQDERDVPKEPFEYICNAKDEQSAKQMLEATFYRDRLKVINVEIINE